MIISILDSIDWWPPCRYLGASNIETLRIFHLELQIKFQVRRLCPWFRFILRVFWCPSNVESVITKRSVRNVFRSVEDLTFHSEDLSKGLRVRVLGHIDTIPGLHFVLFIINQMTYFVTICHTWQTLILITYLNITYTIIYGRENTQNNFVDTTWCRRATKVIP